MKKTLFLFFLPLMFSCTNNNKDKKSDIPNHEYSEVANKQIKWLDMFSLDSNCYYIYFYSEHCVHCHSIKNEIIHIAINGTKDIRFCNDTNIVISDGDLSQTIGKESVAAVFIKGFPSVIKISNHKISHNICGATKVLQHIKE